MNPVPATLIILRDPLTPDPEMPTLGEMSAVGLYPSICTLEDPWRGNAAQVSCIPEGEYRIALAYSDRFGRIMPRLLNVPGRDGILVHAGNTQSDTEGCVLVGRDRGPEGRSIHRSTEAFLVVYGWLDRMVRDGVTTVCRISRRIPNDF